MAYAAEDALDEVVGRARKPSKTYGPAFRHFLIYLRDKVKLGDCMLNDVGVTTLVATIYAMAAMSIGRAANA